VRKRFRGVGRENAIRLQSHRPSCGACSWTLPGRHSGYPLSAFGPLPLTIIAASITLESFGAKHVGMLPLAGELRVISYACRMCRHSTHFGTGQIWVTWQSIRVPDAPSIRMRFLERSPNDSPPFSPLAHLPPHQDKSRPDHKSCLPPVAATFLPDPSIAAHRQARRDSSR